MQVEKVSAGTELPDFELPSSHGVLKTKNDLVGKNTVLFIYPKDDTSSCTKEAKDFSTHRSNFLELDVKVIGVSKDTVKSHNKFIDKYALDIELLSDENIEFIGSVGSWVEKSMYGKTYMGVERTTILVSKTGKIIKIWRKVKVPGHVKDVLTFTKDNLAR